MGTKDAGRKDIRVKISKEFVSGMDELVKDGWFPSRDYIVEKALKKFLNSNRPELLEKAILEDVKNALGGKRSVKGTRGL